MSEQAFGIKKIELKGSGIPTFNSPTDLNLNAVNVAISTNVSIGGSIVSNVIVGNGYSVGIGTTNPTDKLTVRDGDISVGVSTAHGIILTSPNGTRFRLIVADDGTISSSLVS